MSSAHLLSCDTQELGFYPTNTTEEHKRTQPKIKDCDTQKVHTANQYANKSTWDHL